MALMNRMAMSKGNTALTIILSGVLFSFSAFNAHSHPTDSEIVSIIKKVTPSVVAVGSVQATRRPSAILKGTGFAVGDGTYIVTNAHVIPKKLDIENRETLSVFSGNELKKVTRIAHEVARDEAHDISILKIAGEPLTPLVLGNSDKVEVGEQYLFTGFPIGQVLGFYQVTHRGYIASITPAVMPAYSSSQLTPRLIKRMRNPYPVFQLDGTAYPGNSGSPLYDPQTGKVIGIINKVFVKESKETTISKPSGITYAIPAKFIIRLLKSNKIH